MRASYQRRLLAGYRLRDSQPSPAKIASYLRLENSMHLTGSKLTRPVSFSIVMFLLLGYVLMGCMMAEQNRTISAQRDLIHKLFQDTVRLAVVRSSQNQASQR